MSCMDHQQCVRNTMCFKERTGPHTFSVEWEGTINVDPRDGDEDEMHKFRFSTTEFSFDGIEVRAEEKEAKKILGKHVVNVEDFVIKKKTKKKCVFGLVDCESSKKPSKRQKK